MLRFIFLASQQDFCSVCYIKQKKLFRDRNTFICNVENYMRYADHRNDEPFMTNFLEAIYIVCKPHKQKFFSKLKTITLFNLISTPTPCASAYHFL